MVTLAMTNFESNFEVLIVTHVSTKMMVMSEGHNLVYFYCMEPNCCQGCI